MYSNSGARECHTCAAGQFGQVDVVRTSVDHCGACDQATSEWSEWSSCSLTCGGGVQTRSRSILTSANSGADVCPTVETRECNTDNCPSQRLCVYLKCRFQIGAYGNLAIQVYHHHRDSNSVHHCQLYDAPGIYGPQKKCHCLCYDNSTALEQAHAPAAQLTVSTSSTTAVQATASTGTTAVITTTPAPAPFTPPPTVTCPKHAGWCIHEGAVNTPKMCHGIPGNFCEDGHGHSGFAACTGYTAPADSLWPNGVCLFACTKREGWCMHPGSTNTQKVCGGIPGNFCEDGVNSGFEACEGYTAPAGSAWPNGICVDGP